MSNSQSPHKNIEKITKTNVFVPRKNISEILKELNISWTNPRITDEDYPFNSSFQGEWEVEILRPKNKIAFNDIIKISKEDGYSTATIFHLFSFVLAIKDEINQFRSILAAGSLCVDDFECIGCVVLSIEGNNLKLGLGNWRGSKIGGYDILRVKKI